MDESSNVETPDSFKYFSFLSAISAAAGNNYHMSLLQGNLIVKPNIYTILLGPSGIGKEWPIWLVTELVQRSETTRVISGRSSIQAIVKELASARTRPDRPPITDSRAIIINGELSTAIIEDSDALTILTDLYDRKSRWSNLLKGAGEEVLKNPYVTTLFGSSPAHFQDSIPIANIEGGFIGRNFLVREEKLTKQIDLISEDEKETSDFPFQKFVPHLELISRKGGRIIPDNDCKNRFNEWRKKWREANSSTADNTGFVARVPVHVLKVAMCLVLSDYESQKTLIMGQNHIEESIEQVTNLRYGTQRAVDGKGLDQYSIQTKMVLDFLINADGNTLTRKQILVKGYGNFNAIVLDGILDNLLEINWITRSRIFAGSRSDWEIHLAGKPLTEYLNFLEKAKASRMKHQLQKEQV